MTDVAALALRFSAEGGAQAINTAKNVERQSTKTESAARKLNATTSKSEEATKSASSGFRNLSLQLNQVGQQTAVTGNFFQSLAIQLPDILLSFGTLGIAAGAVVGGLAAYFSSAGDANKQSETLAETISTLSGKLTEAKDGTKLLSEELRELAAISADAARIELIVNAQQARSSAVAAANEVINVFQDIAGENPLLPDTIYSDRLGDVSETLRITREDAEALAEALPRTAERSQDAYQNLLGVVVELANKYGSTSPQVLKLAEALGKSGVQAIQAIRTEEDLQKALEDTNGLLERSAPTRDGDTVYGSLYEAAEQATNRVLALNESLLIQVATFGEGERAIALAKLAQLEKNGADAEAIIQARQLTNALYDKIEAEEAAKEAVKAAEEAERQRLQAQRIMLRDLAQLDPAGTEFNRYADQLDRIEQYNISAREKEMLREEAFSQHQDRMIAIANRGNEQYQNYADIRQRLDDQILSSATQMAGNIAGAIGNMVGQQSNAYRVAFLAQQGFALATSIINTQMAAAAALAPPPIGLGPVAGAAYAGVIQGLGAANIAVIAGQTLTGLAGTFQGSFLGGGFTGTGPRTGGLDGKGGFPAILHPNETVIDHTLGQGMGDIYLVINNAPAGTSAEVSRGRDGTITIDMFQADMANGGPMSRSMQSTFGMRRQGR